MKSSITVRLDEQLKLRTESVLEALGSNPTQAITHLYHYVAAHGRLPFRVNVSAETPEDVYREALRRATAVSKSLDAMQKLPYLSERASLELSAYDLGVSETIYAAADAATYILANLDFMNTLPPRGDGSFSPGVAWPLVLVYLNQAGGALADAGGTTGDQPDSLHTPSRLLGRHVAALADYLNAPEAGADVS